MKTKKIFWLLLGLTGFISGCKHFETDFCEHPINQNFPDTLQTICFGSCVREFKEQPILWKIAAQNPDLFIYLGDNVYGDTEIMDQLRNKYAMLSCKPEFQNLCSSTPILAVWDDHDYGHNDIGYEYCKKNESKEIFLEFWQEPLISNRRNHEGIYDVRYFGDSVHRVQIILLDTRTFRSKLEVNDDGYIASNDLSKTMLGSAQWSWLSQALLEPAQIRIICTSTQFATEHNYMEAWANFPKEQEHMAQVIRDAQANGVVFISGDVHYAELSKRMYTGNYPLYDATSSGLTEENEGIASNSFRVFDAYNHPNFGKIEINWNGIPTLTFKIFNANGDAVREQIISLEELQF
ncbi:MAG: alkaline phosphatase D family protein [Sediminibacterium sp.]